MKMEPLKGGSLRIWMTHTDMQHWGLQFERLDARDACTRRALLRLISVAQERLAFRADGELTVEALPIDGGCLLLLAPLTPLLICPTEPTVYTVHTADDLLRLGSGLCRFPQDTLPTASLFAWDEEYRLIVYADKAPTTALRRLLGEFADRTAKGYTAAAFTEEHGRAVAVGNALQQLRH
ncbi:MAG: hypothetical protein IKB04_07475 [Clostridia bacterium]|nr:hypothetical protein [Clostridia bacterium]